MKKQDITFLKTRYTDCQNRRGTTEARGNLFWKYLFQMHLTCRRKVGLVRVEILNGYSDLLQGLHSLDLLGEAVEHGLTTAQQVGLQNHSHALAEVQAACHLTADVPEEEVADSLALRGRRRHWR